MPIIELKKITKEYASNVGYFNVSLSIAKREVVKFKIDHFREIPFSLETHFLKFYQEEANFDD